MKNLKTASPNPQNESYNFAVTLKIGSSLQQLYVSFFFFYIVQTKNNCVKHKGMK